MSPAAGKSKGHRLALGQSYSIDPASDTPTASRARHTQALSLSPRLHSGSSLAPAGFQGSPGDAPAGLGLGLGLNTDTGRSPSSSSHDARATVAIRGQDPDKDKDKSQNQNKDQEQQQQQQQQQQQGQPAPISTSSISSTSISSPAVADKEPAKKPRRRLFGLLGSSSSSSNSNASSSNSKPATTAASTSTSASANKPNKPNNPDPAARSSFLGRSFSTRSSRPAARPLSQQQPQQHHHHHQHSLSSTSAVSHHPLSQQQDQGLASSTIGIARSNSVVLPSEYKNKTKDKTKDPSAAPQAAAAPLPKKLQKRSRAGARPQLVHPARIVEDESDSLTTTTADIRDTAVTSTSTSTSTSTGISPVILSSAADPRADDESAGHQTLASSSATASASASASAFVSSSSRPFRHSIAVLPSISDSASASASVQHSPSSPSSFHTPTSDAGPFRAPLSVFNTSAAQSPDIDEGGSQQPSSLWSGSVAPAATTTQHYQPYPGAQQQQQQQQHLHPAEISRPSSRQSVEPSPSPAQGPYIAYHPHAAVSQTSINRSEVSRDPSPAHQQLRPSLPRTVSSQSPGNFGQTLDADNAGRKPVSKALGMVQNGEAGRSTPPPSKSKEDLATLDFPQLLSKHEELNEKYRKVKKYYFEKDAQVTNLQNTLAHQRLSQSRTSLDDNEYSSRFQRLDGAINNLAFNVRKDWKAVPPWLSPYVNSDAAANKTKEMTAVGRACISRWLVDEIFDRVFHPALEPSLSSNLKIIERNLRRFAPPVNTDDERDALLTKISNWRLATLDGLQEALNSPTATEYRTELTRGLVETLTSDLQMNLTKPPPAGLEAGVIGIIELAVGVAANIPMESRDVYVEYILPGALLQEAYMKVEGTLPPLTNPGETYAVENDPSSQPRQNASADEVAEDVNLPIGGFVGAGPRDRKGNAQNRGKSGEGDAPKETEKVRFAAFMSVMIKGKSMLVKAPVFV